jgi:hypothetical protein
MAGSWGHIVNDDGTPYDGSNGMAGLLTDGGDINEAVEEMYGMIWWLAAHRARMRFTTTRVTREQVMDVIQSAQDNYLDGLRLGRGDQ